jgi:hypothetical protein
LQRHDFSAYDWLVIPTLSGQQVSPSGAETFA